MNHDIDLTRVRDNLGWDVGWCATCACQWTSDLHERHGQALREACDHIYDTRPTKDEA